LLISLPGEKGIVIFQTGDQLPAQKGGCLTEELGSSSAAGVKVFSDINVKKGEKTWSN